MRWIIPEPLDQCAVGDLAARLGVPQLAAGLLLRRGYGDPALAAGFIEPRLRTLRDPFLLPDMEAAVERLLAAIDRKESIALYGDYDVDGVTSLALLTRVLRAYGTAPSCFLPCRIQEGYGLSALGVDRCLREHRPTLLIAIDCGTTSVEQIARLRSGGIDVLVLDHHECPGALPDCTALVNPRRSTADHHLCSVGLMFKFAHALLKRRPLPDFDLRHVLDLVALGTVADLVPLVDENRIFVKHGLLRLADSRWAGVRALVEVSGLRPPHEAAHIGFGLGPRLNAAGRLGTALEALELLLTDDASRARTLANSLEAQNRERRAVEDRVCADAEAQIAMWFDPRRHAAIVAAAPDWHPGVVGIVASRLSRRHHRPAIVIGFDEAGMGKGSGRSIAGFCLVSALGKCASHLATFGGHQLAAGLSLGRDGLEAFREAFLAVARAELAEDQLLPRIELDAELPLPEINLDLLQSVENLAPFGIGHRSPLFYARGVEPFTEPRVLKEKHLSFLLMQGGRESRAIWFGAAQPLPPPPWDIAFELARNEYLGRVTPQIQIRALRAAEPA